MNASENAMTEREAVRLLRLKRDQLKKRYGTRHHGETDAYIKALDLAIAALAAVAMGEQEGGGHEPREDHQVGRWEVEKVRL